MSAKLPQEQGKLYLSQSIAHLELFGECKHSRGLHLQLAGDEEHRHWQG